MKTIKSWCKYLCLINIYHYLNLITTPISMRERDYKNNAHNVWTEEQVTLISFGTLLLN